MGFDVVSRGYAKNYLHYDTEFGVFVIAVEKVFSFRVDWHQDDHAQPVVEHYQVALEATLQAHPQLHRCVSHCAHCGIRFLTHSRNAGRRNLRCPFGCRERHREQRSCERSAAYYRTVSGKRKKQDHNRRRRLSSAQSPPLAASQPQTPPPGQEPPTDRRAELRLDGVVLDESSLTNSPVLPYLRMMVSLIEGVPFGVKELLVLLRQGLRQHSIASRKRTDYVLRFLRQHPP
jgi:hypothetical protein